MALGRRKPPPTVSCCDGEVRPGVACPGCGRVARAPGRKRKALRPRNEDRAAKARAENFGELADLVRSLPCCVEGCRRWPVDPAHVVSRRRGAAWIVVDGVEVGNIAPLCRAHHTGPGFARPQHQVGIPTFETEQRLVVRLPGRLAAPAATLAEVAAAVGRWAKDGAPGAGGP